MTAAQAPRQVLATTDIRIPECPLPRPGERVVWYTEAFKRSGTYLGYGPGAKPIVHPDEGIDIHFDSFGELRLETPLERRGPLWCDLPLGCILRPRAEETEKLQKLLRRRIPPGPSYLEVIDEIWNRGFEVFLVGGTVRDVLGGGEAHDVDLVTSLPLRHSIPLLKATPPFDFLHAISIMKCIREIIRLWFRNPSCMCWPRTAAPA
ncbi:MAG: hypothetical protein ABSF25_16210 [Bryobacteraceae bacterium]|jgi:hypothetical protein